MPPSATGGVAPVSVAPAAPAPVSAPGAKRFGKGAVVRIKLKTGLLWIGEIVVETGNGLLVTVGSNTQMFAFSDMQSVDALGAVK
jgi:hypothetical protein